MKHYQTIHDRGARRLLTESGSALVSLAESNADAIDSAIDYCTSGLSGIPLRIPSGTWPTSRKTVVPPGLSVDMEGTLLYTTDDSGMVLGTGTVPSYKAWYRNLNVEKLNRDWPTLDQGVTLNGVSSSSLSIRGIDGFHSGLVLDSDGPKSVMYNNISLGPIMNNRVGVTIRSSFPGSSPNQNTFTGGRIGLWSEINADSNGVPITGVLFESTNGGYTNHNRNSFRNLSTEIGVGNFPHYKDSIPIHMKCGTRNGFIHCGSECSAKNIVVEEVGCDKNHYDFLWAHTKKWDKKGLDSRLTTSDD